jgi:hydrogenase-1 operon protein HyaF
LNEIHSALLDLQANGQFHAIDLRQLPRMSPEVYQALQEALSQGEVSAVINSQVRVEVTETQYPGVWWLRHFNERDEITTEIIEITEMPAILKPHRVDIRAGLQKLASRLPLLGIPSDPVQSCG